MVLHDVAHDGEGEAIGGGDLIETERGRDRGWHWAQGMCQDRPACHERQAQGKKE
jgi:hypothetical protein